MRRLQRRYTPNAQLDPDPLPEGDGADATRNVPLVFVSLLRKGTPDKDRSEAKLASAFDFVSAVPQPYHNLCTAAIPHPPILSATACHLPPLSTATPAALSAP